MYPRTEYFILTSKMNHIGGRLLGEGADGCTFSPAPRCANGKVFKKIGEKGASSIVGKIVDIDNNQEELMIGREIMSISNATKYFALPIVECTPEIPIQDPDSKKCEIITDAKKDTKFTLLGMIYGGITLDFYKDQHERISVNFIPIFKHLLEGMLMYRSIGYIHNDIHVENIIVDNNNIARFIDFGRAFKLATVKNWRGAKQGTSFKPTKNYIWQPPETILWRMRLNGIPVKDGVKLLYNKVDDYRTLEHQFYTRHTLETTFENFIRSDKWIQSLDDVGMIKEYGNHFDNWRIGISMWYCWNDLLHWTGFVNNELYTKHRVIIRDVLGGLTEFDPRNRMSIEKALQLLRSF